MANTRLASIITGHCSSTVLGFDALIYSTCANASVPLFPCSTGLEQWLSKCAYESRIAHRPHGLSHVRESILTLHLSAKAHRARYGELREYVTRHSELFANRICIKFCESYLQAAKFTLLNHELEALHKWSNSWLLLKYLSRLQCDLTTNIITNLKRLIVKQLITKYVNIILRCARKIMQDEGYLRVITVYYILMNKLHLWKRINYWHNNIKNMLSNLFISYIMQKLANVCNVNKNMFVYTNPNIFLRQAIVCLYHSKSVEIATITS